ncbi:MAG: radical SAM protein, partial [Holophaga sp.]
MSTTGTAFQIDENAIYRTLEQAKGHDRDQVRGILAKAILMKGLSKEDVSHLMDITEPDLLDELYHTAKKVKEEIYGNRIVLFAPLYVSNLCGNECVYCAFRASNKTLVRRTLSTEEIAEETRAMIRTGQKRIVLLAGEAYPKEGLDFVLKAIKTVYATKERKGEIRRVNVEIAPLSVEDFRRLKEVEI